MDLILPAVGQVFTIISPYIQFFPITLQLAILGRNSFCLSLRLHIFYFHAYVIIYLYLGDVLSMLCIHIFYFYAYGLSNFCHKYTCHKYICHKSTLVLKTFVFGGKLKGRKKIIPRRFFKKTLLLYQKN